MKKQPSLLQKLNLLLYETSCRCRRLARFQKSMEELYRFLQKPREKKDR